MALSPITGELMAYVRITRSEEVSTVIYPRRPVLTVCCDGGFMMNSREMETAVRLHLNVVALVLQDNMFANTSYADRLIRHYDLAEIATRRCVSQPLRPQD
jgi:Thiamine pyrophosphate enzyme, C-terminal TPP binding domain